MPWSPFVQVVKSWGRLRRDPHDVVTLLPGRDIAAVLKGPAGIAYGMGRSYGDVCLNPGGRLWRTTRLDHFIAFDGESGRLRCEAGVLLRDIQRLALPRGWTLPVTPGTQLITVGGAIANDIHGKSHHRYGSFGDHVRWLRLVRSDGQSLVCGPSQHPEWFAATVGGIGLTGVIVDAELQLVRSPGPFVETETFTFAGMADFVACSRDADDWAHTVAWVDCSSAGGRRGVFMRGRPVPAGHRAAPTGRQVTLPFEPPVSLINGLTTRIFNELYFQRHRWRATHAVMPVDAFLYPLDRVDCWNRIYGPRGFYQYQCVVDESVAQDAVGDMLDVISGSSVGSSLAVLKTFGARTAPGLLSFCQPGVTLAVDIRNVGPDSERLMSRLDAMVAEAGGKLYLAKDARMSREFFERGYPAVSRFLAFRDPGMSSAMSRRLLGS